MTTSEPKKTPLYENHVAAGGKIVDFAGWYLPVQFKGIIAEHEKVRKGVGLFDVSHMGEILVTGAEAEKSLQYLTFNDLKAMYDGRCQYSALTMESGALVDDIIINRFSPNKFFICVNASNAEKDFRWLIQRNTFDCEIQNLSAHYGQIAIQGPLAASVMKKIFPPKILALKTYHFTTSELKGIELIVARTGYTGEDGFEVYCPWQETPVIWNILLEAGATEGIAPIGLGARDTLRLESGYSLYGHELSEELTALESGLSRFVKLEKGEFLGSQVLNKQKRDGVSRTLVGFYVDEPGIVRGADKLYSKSGAEIGFVTSGTKSPTLNVSLGMAIVKTEASPLNTEIFADVRGRKIKCHVVKRPFYSRS